MTFKDFPHPKQYETGFIMAQDFLEYQREYVKHHQLEPFMKFNSFVKKVSLNKENEHYKEKFEVSVCDSESC